MQTLEAIVKNITYRNEDNGYSVIQIKSGRENITAVGVLPLLVSGEQIVIKGEWKEHPQYGRQIEVTECKIIEPTTLLGIERYLSSGIIKGVGPATAKLLVKHFGIETLDILMKEPHRLLEVPKIGNKRAEQITTSYHEQIHTRNAMIFLQSYGVSSSLSVKISKKYGENTRKIIQENPYILVKDIEGIGFITADRIALVLGVSPDSKERISSGIQYILSSYATSKGHTCVPIELLVKDASNLLKVPKELIETNIKAMLIARHLISANKDENTMIYLPLYFNAEKEVAFRLHNLIKALPYKHDPSINSQIKEFENQKDIKFHSEQKKAIQAAMDEGVTIITGGPGTGKTTIINCIIWLLNKTGKKISLCAPSGRAAKRMTEATNTEAKTIHRLLEYGGEEGTFLKDMHNPLEIDCVIIDEMSMVDILLIRNLLRALIPGTMLIMVGDANQLPSVGAGNVLSDMLISEIFPSVKLSEIFRQDESSMIVLNAHRINKGDMPICNSKGSDVFFERKETFEQAAKTIVDLCKNRLPEYIRQNHQNIQTPSGIQVLSPMKKGECGVWQLNRLLQDALNPQDPFKKEVSQGENIFRLGDKVMQIKNDYQIQWERRNADGKEEGTGIFNGDIGVISSIDQTNGDIKVIFDDDKKVTYQEYQRENLELAYCISIHKSQGSEFPIVVMPVVGGPPMLLTRNLFYTAITRAKKLVVMVGKEEIIEAMVKNNHIAQRYTSLENSLTELVGSY